MKEDFYLSSVMVSKLCHDLIGSSSTLTFSLGEYLKEGEANKDAVSLALKSANIFVNRLKYFRAAFGTSFFSSGTTLVDDVRLLIVDLCKEKDIYLNWLTKYDNLLEEYLNLLSMKLFLNIFLVIFYNIPKSATINVIVSKITEDKVGVMLVVKGYKIALKSEIINILYGKAGTECINPNNINIFFTYFLKQKANSEIEVSNNSNNEGLKIAFSLSKAVS